MSEKNRTWRRPWTMLGGGNGGASSWNDLKDKPFYEETTEVGGDTLTWDGNTDGHVTFVDSYVHVSDAVPTMDDFSNGFVWRNADGETEITADSISDNGGMLMCEYVMVVPYDNFALEGAPIAFEKKGIYLVIEFGEQSITIPDYNGFETTTIKPLDQKFLPESVITKEKLDAQIYEMLDAGEFLTIKSSTENSTKWFMLTVDDSGTISATEVT